MTWKPNIPSLFYVVADIRAVGVYQGTLAADRFAVKHLSALHCTV